MVVIHVTNMVDVMVIVKIQMVLMMTVHLLQHVKSKATLIVVMDSVFIPHGYVMAIQTAPMAVMKLTVHLQPVLNQDVATT